jgi:superfamily II DNA or RNA helicase
MAMINAQEIKPGKLIKLRGREWVVLPSDDREVLNIKPLGGTATEITSVYIPFEFGNEKLEEVYFPLPNTDRIGDFNSAKLLYDAVRLSFREAAGPFRSIGKLNFTPRAYQMVPLIMALKQENPVRLFIADDVGIGKTVESLMIVRELLDRGIIKRFAIICLPHLCEQWAQELRDKFAIEAAIFTSGNAAKLRKQVPISQDPLEFYPFQILSIDYVKSDSNSAQFISGCPELVIVDEIHTCADDGTSKKQLRHRLIHRIADKPNQHLILLSATPHSGKPEQFKSILGLLNKKFLDLDLSKSSREQREELAKYYVQRRREDIKSWTGKNVKQETAFPNRESYEVEYTLNQEYLDIQKNIMKLATQMVKDKTGKKARISYWTALGLIRGVMSSPFAGIAMLDKRASLDDETGDDIQMDNINPVIEDDYNQNDDSDIVDGSVISDDQIPILKGIKQQLEIIEKEKRDQKVNTLIDLIIKWQKEGFYPIVYCRYIKTAEYLYARLADALGNKITVNIITSMDPEEARKEKVESLKLIQAKVLVATDCMSEGINLQDCFNAVIHYDLPWNPNRLEQREGRVDRFGQAAPIVKTALLYGKNNPMDGVVLKVLLQKAKEIKKSIGISVPFPENNQSIMETVTQAILMKAGEDPTAIQLSIFDDEEIMAASSSVDAAYKKIEEIEKVSRSIFTQHSIKAQDIDKDLDEAIRLIGDIQSVEQFVLQGMRRLGGQVEAKKDGYVLHKTGLPPSFIHFFDKEEMKVCFDTPVPYGYRYISRNHDIVDHLCQTFVNEAMHLSIDKPSIVHRIGVIKTQSVQDMAVTILLLRVRNVIESIATKHQIVAEELMLWGYQGDPSEQQWLDESRCLELIQSVPNGEMSYEDKREMVSLALEDIEHHRELINIIARTRAEILVEAHDRFRIAVKGKRYQVVEPILPMDVMGIYILMPN